MRRLNTKNNTEKQKRRSSRAIEDETNDQDRYE